MFERGEIVPFFMYACDEPIGRVIFSVFGRFGFRKYVWSVVSNKLREDSRI